MWGETWQLTSNSRLTWCQNPGSTADASPWPGTAGEAFTRPTQSPASPRPSRGLYQRSLNRCRRDHSNFSVASRCRLHQAPAPYGASWATPPASFVKLPAGQLGGDGDRDAAAPPHHHFPEETPFPPPPNCRKCDKTIKTALHQPRKLQNSGQGPLASWENKNSRFFMKREIETKIKP